MHSLLPNEIALYFPFFTEKEQQFILSNIEGGIEKNLEVGSEVLLKTITAEQSETFLLILGRTLFHAGKTREIKEIYEKHKQRTIGYWYVYSLIDERAIEQAKEILETLKTEQEEGCSTEVLFKYYLNALIAYFIADHKNYESNRENIYNFPLCVTRKASHNVFNKLIIAYMLVLDFYYLKEYDNLLVSRQKLDSLHTIMKSIDDQILNTLFHNSLGLFELEKGNFTLAYSLFLKSNTIASNIKEVRIQSFVSMNLTDLFISIGRLKEAEEYCNKANELYKIWLNKEVGKHFYLSKKSEIETARGNFVKALELLENAKELIENGTFLDKKITIKYIELLLYTNKINEAKVMLEAFVKTNRLQKLNPLIEPNIHFMRGYLSYLEQDYGDALLELKKTLEYTDKLGNEQITFKTLILISVVFMKKYNITKSLDDLTESDKCFDDLINFLEEKGKLDHGIFLYLTRSKIKMMLDEDETALKIIKEGEKHIRAHFPAQYEEFKEKLNEIQVLFERNEETAHIKESITFEEEEFKTILSLAWRESTKVITPTQDKPLAIMIFHLSGLPLRSYLSKEVKLSDDLLFGGLISAIKNITIELFKNRTSQDLSIQHGDLRILLEFSNNFTVAVIASRDSFLIRKKMNNLVKQLDYHGKIKPSIRELGDLETIEIDKIVESIFGIKALYVTNMLFK